MKKIFFSFFGMVILLFTSISYSAVTVSFTNLDTSMDGYIRDGTYIQTSQSRIRVGKSGGMCRGFFSIPISLPAGATVTSSTLQFGRNPFSSSGDATLGNPYFFSLVNIGSALEAGDYYASTNLSNFLTYTDDGGGNSLIRLNASNAIQYAIDNNLTNFQVMVYTTNSSLPDANYLAIADLDNGTISPPNQVLTVTYQMPPPSTPTGLTSVKNSQDYETVELSWNVSSTATSYTLYRNLTNDTNSSTVIGGTTNLTYQDITAVADDTNYYWVKAFSLYGESGFSSVSSVVTSPDSVPATPSFVSADYVFGSGTTNVVLIWNNVDNEKNYKIYTSTTNNSNNAVLVTNIAKNITMFTDNPADKTKTNYYWVKATNSLGASGLSVTNVVLVPPSTPAYLNSSVDTVQHSVILNWEKISSATSYTLFRYSSNDTNSTTNYAFTSSANQTTYTDNSVITNTTYYYWIKSYNPLGASSFSPVTVATIPVPWPPANPTFYSANGLDVTHIELVWENVSNETGYKIYRSTTSNITTAIYVGSVNSDITNFTDSGLFPETTYYYWVQSYNAGGANPTSTLNSANAQTLPGTDLKISTKSENGTIVVSLKWNTPSGFSPTGYRIYYSSTPVSSSVDTYFDVSSSTHNTNISVNVTDNNILYYNIGYTTNGTDFYLDGPAENFMAMIIQANTLGFNNIITISNVYDYVKSLGISQHSEMIGPMVSAFDTKVYKLYDAPHSSYPTILDAPGSSQADVDVIYNGVANDTSRYRIPDGTGVLFDFKAYIKLNAVNVWNGFNYWSKVLVYVSEYETGPWTVGGQIDGSVITGGNDSGPYPILMSDEANKMKVRYVKVVGYALVAGSEFDFDEIEFDYDSYSELVNNSDIHPQTPLSLSFPYLDGNNNGYPELYDGSAEINQTEQSLSLYQLNGTAWLPLAGSVDASANTVTSSLKNFGTFAIFPSSSSSQDTIVFSQKYLSPNNDGENDVLSITVNPDASTKIDIKIFDLSGRMITQIADNQNITGKTVFIWNGKTKYGEDLKIGPYLYEIRFDGKVQENGLVLIVR